ncbi:TfoX/Sxy family protein [Rhodococcoides trifolii]|nr:TfoX/Sxy family protein [Rhodococcus trifolii]
MAYDDELVERVRDALSYQKRLRELKMFGGKGFIVNDTMACCVGVGRDALLVRVDSERDAEYLKIDGARRADLGDDQSTGEGWITVEDKAVATDEGLKFWVDAALEYNSMVTGGAYGEASIELSDRGSRSR